MAETSATPGRWPHFASPPGPPIRFVQELLGDGYVGEVISTTMVGLSVPGDVVVQANAYMLDKANGANVLAIAVSHRASRV